MRKIRQQLTTPRAVEIYREALSIRRELYKDDQFFKAIEAWGKICGDSEKWRTKTYQRRKHEPLKIKAGITEFADIVILTVDAELIERAKNGCKLCNYILAHEMGHLMLDHHAHDTVVKHYQLFSTERGLANIPPTLEEYEANLAAVFFQCGTHLENSITKTTDLANRAFTDVNAVRAAQQMVQMEVFQEELKKPRRTYPRVIL